MPLPKLPVPETVKHNRLVQAYMFARCKLAHKVAHGDHISHMVYLGSVTFAAHEFAHYAEVVSFVLVTGHFIMTGWED
jgi:hypothetical protein